MVEPIPADFTGRTLGDFHLLRKIGQGGMGQVYLARQLSLKRDVALKILSQDLAQDATALARFQAEAEAVARISHANIVQVYAVGEVDGLHYMALEYVEGRNLKDYLARKGPPELPIALSIIRQIALALQRARELGLVHRDIKPENILVTRKVEVKIADFGLSRYFANSEQSLNLTMTGITLGTPLYMSPEQVQGLAVDHRSDLYSLGVTVYHMLAGAPPFTGTTAFEVALQHVQAEPHNLAESRIDLPTDLILMVHRLMAKSPDQRYQSARELLRDLANIKHGVPLPIDSDTTQLWKVVKPADSPLSKTTAFRSRAARQLMRLSVIGLSLFSMALGWFGYGYWLQTRPIVEAAPTSLPTERLPQPLHSTRERQLEAVLQSRSTPSVEILEASLNLGVLLIKEQRYPEAEQIFQQLQNEDPLNLDPTKGRKPSVYSLVGMLGSAMVLSHQDKAEESNQHFEQLLIGNVRSNMILLEGLILKQPIFGEALAEALNRNAANLERDTLHPKLEWLRSPGGLIRGPQR